MSGREGLLVVAFLVVVTIITVGGGYLIEGLPSFNFRCILAILIGLFVLNFVVHALSGKDSDVVTEELLRSASTKKDVRTWFGVYGAYVQSGGVTVLVNGNKKQGFKMYYTDKTGLKVGQLVGQDLTSHGVVDMLTKIFS